jgi:hypothetical protein
MELLIIIILLIVLFFLLNDKKEKFETNYSETLKLKQCDYNDPKLTARCKEIRESCKKLKKEETDIVNKFNNGCGLNKELNTARETLSAKRDCVTDAERLIRTKYAKNEMCSMMKNVPKEIIANNKVKTLNFNDVFAYDRNGSYSDARF